MKNLIAVLGLAFIGWWVITDPVSAGHALHALGDLLNSAATALKTALSSA